MQALIVPTFFMALFLYFGALCGFFDVDYEVFSEYHYAAEMLLVAIIESLTKKKLSLLLTTNFSSLDLEAMNGTAIEKSNKCCINNT